jgi:hypothetical protein
MEDFYSFLRPRTPDPSFDELLSAFSSDQIGEGVVTRRQARLAQSVSDVQAQPTHQPQVVVQPQPQPQLEPDVQAQSKGQPTVEDQHEVAKDNRQLSPVPSSSTEDLDAADAPYLKDTLVASNNDVEAYCVKSFFRKMKTFASTDTLFKIHLKPISKKVILWSSLEDILTKVLTVVLTAVQQHHKDDTNALLYFCIAQTPLVSGIRSSVHVLAQNTVASIVANFLSDFHRFVSSNAEMKLNDTFELYLHVASALNLSRPTNRRKAVPVRSLVGVQTDLKVGFLSGSLINLPSGYPENVNCFKDACAVACLTYSMLEITDPQKCLKLRPLLLSQSTIAEKNEAGKILNDEMQILADKTNISVNGPHEINAVVESFAAAFSIQVIVVISLIGGQLQTFCSPSPIDLSIPRVYVCMKTLGDGINHMLVIKSLSTFYKTLKRAVCFFCDKFYSTGFGKKKQARHKCKKCCKRCFGFLREANTLQQFNEPWQYCDTKLNTTNLNQCCANCGFFFSTQICFSNHLRYCSTNMYFWSCPVCQKSVAMKGKASKEIEREHKCSEDLKHCQVCCTMKPANHVCLITKAKVDKDWPNVGVISLTYQNGVSGICQICYENRKNYMHKKGINYAQLLGSKMYAKLACVNHLDKEVHVANVIKVFYENRRFEFASRTFSTKNFLAHFEDIDEINFGYCDTPMPFSGRKRKLEVILKQNSVTASDQLINYLLDGNLSNHVFLVQSNAEMLSLLEIFVKDYQPVVVQNGRNLKKLQINQFNISFILFENYCEGTLFSLLRQFGINRSIAYFPDSFNDPTFHGKSVVKPEFDWFLAFHDDSKQKIDKLSFYSNLPNVFDVNQQLYKCVSQNLKSFLLVTLHFLRQCFDLQLLLGTLTSAHTRSPPVHPFHNVMSLSGFSMAICRFFYLNNYHIASIAKPYTGYSSKVSSREYEYVSFLTFSKPKENIKHAFNSTFGQKEFSPYPVDAYGEKSLIVYQYHSCELHGHTVPFCTNKSVVSRCTKDSSRNCYGTLIQDLQKKEKQCENVLLSQYGDSVKKYNVMWDCVFQSFKKANKVIMEEFWNQSGLDKLRPLSRLVPRASVRGGFLEVYRLSFEANSHQDLHFYDMNAQYSFIALTAQLPLGEYQIFLEHELKKALRFENNQFLLNGESCVADIAHVTFVVPSDLAMPFLPIRIGDNCFYANCYTCLTKANCSVCRHKSDDKRKFSSTYTVLELQKALELNYKIYVHELWHFSQTKNVLNEFVSVMASYRLRNSADIAEDKKSMFCDLVNAKMHFVKPELMLSPSKIQSNPAQKQFFKNILNSLFGRFALHTNYSNRVFISSQNELNTLAANKNNTILELIPITDTVMQVEYLSKKQIHSSRESNLFFTSIINASGRLFMYELMQKLKSLQCTPLYCDTDGIIFNSPKGFTQFPFEIGDAFGQFKAVLGKAQLKKFFCLGPRNYALVYEEDGISKYLTKIKGICAKSDNVQNIITPLVYEDFINSHFQNEIKSIYIPQMKKRVPKELNSFQFQMITQKFTNEIHIKRFILKSQTSHVTYPYGFNFKNVDWK